MVDIENDRQKGIQFAAEMDSVFPFGDPPNEVSKALADHLLSPHKPLLPVTQNPIIEVE